MTTNAPKDDILHLVDSPDALHEFTGEPVMPGQEPFRLNLPMLVGPDSLDDVVDARWPRLARGAAMLGAGLAVIVVGIVLFQRPAAPKAQSPAVPIAPLELEHLATIDNPALPDTLQAPFAPLLPDPEPVSAATAAVQSPPAGSSVRADAPVALTLAQAAATSPAFVAPAASTPAVAVPAAAAVVATADVATPATTAPAPSTAEAVVPAPVAAPLAAVAEAAAAPAAAPVRMPAVVAPATAAAPPVPAAAVAAVLPAGEMETRAIQNVLARYRNAFNALDASGASAVWPGVNEKNLAKAFERIEQQNLSFDSCRIDVGGVMAEATCTGTARFVPRVGNRTPKAEAREWRFAFRKVAAGWVIDRVDAR